MFNSNAEINELLLFQVVLPIYFSLYVCRTIALYIKLQFEQDEANEHRSHHYTSTLLKLYSRRVIYVQARQELEQFQISKFHAPPIIQHKPCRSYPHTYVRVLFQRNVLQVYITELLVYAIYLY